MKKLISNTVFGEYLNTKNIPDYEYRYCRFQYDQFLLQPLELWMFVPCGEGGNVLEVVDCNLDIRVSELKLYQQAKESCIFNNNLLSLTVIKELISKNKTVEFLINYHYEETGSYLETNKELF